MDVGKKVFGQPGSKWLVIGSIVASLGFTAVGIHQVMQLQAAKQQAEEQALNAKPVKREITALGRLEPEGEVLNVSGPNGPNGERIGQLLVREGQFVKTGQTLAYLESYEERLAERDLAANQLAEAQARLKAETSYGRAQIQEARSRVAMVTNPKSAAILAQQATIERIQAELINAQRDLRRFAQLQAEGAVSQQALDDRNLAVKSKQQELSNAQSTLAQLQQEKVTDLDNANAQLSSAQAELARSQTQVQIASAASNLKLAQARLDRTMITAPQSGQILKIHTHSGESIGDKGILEMGNTRQMSVVAEVYETDIAKIKVGQPATITSSAFNGSIPGTVTQVGLRIGKNDVLNTDPAANTDARVVEVRIRLKDSQKVAGLTNLQVDVAIAPQMAATGEK
uniref:ABC exporter membrane fusion protein, DevB family n=1 Tax=Cyanothece sp. (strain PCC 7425 / ATCC 29141) TaxID=395961 RepID=B8HSS6_CYAP4